MGRKTVVMVTIGGQYAVGSNVHMVKSTMVHFVNLGIFITNGFSSRFAVILPIAWYPVVRVLMGQVWISQMAVMVAVDVIAAIIIERDGGHETVMSVVVDVIVMSVVKVRLGDRFFVGKNCGVSEVAVGVVVRVLEVGLGCKEDLIVETTLRLPLLVPFAKYLSTLSVNIRQYTHLFSA